MKKLNEYADLLVRIVNAFEVKVGGKYSDLEAVEALIPTLRQEAILIKYNGNANIAASKKIDPACLQSFLIAIDSAAQDAEVDYLVFNSPRFVNVSKGVSGDIYVGAKRLTQAFKKVYTRTEIDTLKTRGYLNDGKHILYMSADDKINVYGNKMLKEIWIEGILVDPIEATNFNAETDPYPMSEDIFTIVMDLFKQKVGITVNQVQDNVDNDTSSQGRGATKPALA
jgi:hypothetical protein